VIPTGPAAGLGLLFASIRRESREFGYLPQPVQPECVWTAEARARGFVPDAVNPRNAISEERNAGLLCKPLMDCCCALTDLGSVTNAFPLGSVVPLLSRYRVDHIETDLRRTSAQHLLDH